MKFRIIIAGFFWVFGSICEAQEVRKFNAVRTDHSPKIDGELDDRVWKETKPASNFIEFKPLPGRLEPRRKKNRSKNSLR
jgi:hypothetical protein